MKILIATRNLGKFKEISAMLAELPLHLVSLRDYPDLPEVEEDGETYLANAIKKADMAATFSDCWVLADDSGLEVEGLAWKPGIHSARFAKPGASDKENNAKLLEMLKEREGLSRRAVFRCTLVLFHPDGAFVFTEGELWGEILDEPRGSQGFGYDPLFYLSEKTQTLAELDAEEKNRISHRTMALEKMKEHIQHLLSKNL